MAVMTLIAIAGAMVVPSVLAGLDRSRGVAAARYLAARFAFARTQAVSRSAVVALRFEQAADGVSFAVFQDGNRDGVRTRDIQRGIDFSIEPAIRLGQLFPGVEIGLAPGTGAAAPVQLSGGSSLLSFTPAGTATGGSVYVRARDGTQWVVRVLGATARTRVLRLDPRTGQWITQL